MGFRDLIGSLKTAVAGPGAPPVPPVAELMPAEGVGAFGKTPARPDFFRVDAGPFSAAGFERWLEDGVGALASAGLPLPDQAVDFFACAAMGMPACLGAIGPSHDRVGRAFPLALFAYVDGIGVDGRTTLAQVGSDLLAAARARVATLAATEDPTALALDLPVMDPTALDVGAAAALAELGFAPVCATLEAMFPPIEHPTTAQGTAGALATVLAACRAAPSPPARATLTLELPAFDTKGMSFWLELLRRALGWTAASPSWLWARESARLLVALGPPSPDLIVELMRPGSPGSRHWVIECNEAAASTLPSPIAEVLATERATIAALLGAITPATR